MNPRRHPLIDLRDHGLSDVARIFETLAEPGISVLHEAADEWSDQRHFGSAGNRD